MRWAVSGFMNSREAQIIKTNIRRDYFNYCTPAKCVPDEKALATRKSQETYDRNMKGFLTSHSICNYSKIRGNFFTIAQVKTQVVVFL